MLTTFSVSKEGFTEINEQDYKYDLSAYTTSDSLYIENDTDLEGNSSSGNGVAGDPFVIENLSIETTDSIGIYIAF